MSSRKDVALDALANALLGMPRVIAGAVALFVMCVAGSPTFTLFHWWPTGFVGFLLGGLAFGGIIFSVIAVAAAPVFAYEWAKARIASRRSAESGVEHG